MIKTIVVVKVNRTLFRPHRPTTVMVGFFNDAGEQLGSQLLNANLFDEDISEGQEINFKKEAPMPFYELSKQSGRDEIN